MPSSNNTSFAEKLLHTRALLRVAVHRGDVNQVWESPEEKQIFETFIGRCINEAEVTFQDLLMIHDHELVQLFEVFAMNPWERCVVRRYLDLPEDALWVAWTAAKVSLFCVATAFRASRAVLGVPGLLMLSAGVGLGLVGKHFRGRLIDEAAKMVARHHEKLYGTSSPHHYQNLAGTQVSSNGATTTDGNSLSATTAAPALPSTRSATNSQQTPRGGNIPLSINSRTMEKLRSNPFYDPEDMPSKTPRYPVPKFENYDFRAASGSPPLSEEYVHVDEHHDS